MKLDFHRADSGKLYATIDKKLVRCAACDAPLEFETTELVAMNLTNHDCPVRRGCKDGCGTKPERWIVKTSRKGTRYVSCKICKRYIGRGDIYTTREMAKEAERKFYGHVKKEKTRAERAEIT